MDSLVVVVNQIEQEISKSYRTAAEMADAYDRGFYNGCAYGLELARRIVVRELMAFPSWSNPNPDWVRQAV